MSSTDRSTRLGPLAGQKSRVSVRGGAFALGFHPALAALALLFALASAARAIQRWERVYGGPTDDRGRSVLQTQDDGYLVAGHGYRQAWLIRTDSLGDTLWTRLFLPAGADQATFRSVISTSDGGYLAAGNVSYPYPLDRNWCYLVRVDGMGDTLWTREFADDSLSSSAYSIVMLDAGGCVLAGTIDDTMPGDYGDVFLKKVDDSGNQVWHRRYGTPYDDYAWEVRQVPDGGFVIAGMTPYLESGVLIRTDSLGDTLWTKAYGGGYWQGFNDVLVLPDSGFMVAGFRAQPPASDAMLVRLDARGNVLWTRTYGSPEHDDTFNGICEKADGGYVCFGQTGTFYPCFVYLAKIDTLGTMVWSRTFGASGEFASSARDGRQTSDGGYILTGNTHGGNGANDVYLIKTDAQGTTEITLPPGPEKPRANREPVIEVRSGLGQTRVVRYYVPQNGCVRLDILDATGRLIRRLADGVRPLGWYEVELPSAQGCGIRFVRLEAGGASATAKVVDLTEWGRR